MVTSENGYETEFGTAVPVQSNLAIAGPNDAAESARPVEVGLLTGGDDRPYALGLASALAGKGVFMDFIGSDALDAPELHQTPLINFLNLRGDQRENAGFREKMIRLLKYYGRLLGYAALSRPRIFHILWNNKFEVIDRVILMLYYRLIRKRIVFTAHNVNAAKRDGKDNLLNRLTLRFQYWMSHHIFVHTERMRSELLKDFNLRETKVTVIPFGINNTIPTSAITTTEAKQRFGLPADQKAALFFGQIAPYKGLEYLVAAMAELGARNERCRLIVAGKVKRGCEGYWEQIESKIASTGIQDQVIKRIEFIPDGEVELYFKAADVVIVPYVDIFQSGVPFLAYSFGLPVIATDVGSLREDILEGKTGYICKPCDPSDLAKCIQSYFSSDLYRGLDAKRQEIREFANQKYSWARVAEITRRVYATLLP
jgi:glycosyltransferase involved in cell wall biosynthesis